MRSTSLGRALLGALSALSLSLACDDSTPNARELAGGGQASVAGESGAGRSGAGQADGGRASSAGNTGSAGQASGNGGATSGAAGSAGAAPGGAGAAGAPVGGAGASGSAGAPPGGAGASPGGAGAAGAATGPGFYATDFNLSESPISEAGKWKQDGLDWTHIVTAGGLAYGTEQGAGGFDDSYAYLAGTFPANQSATATIHLESGITASYQEVELLLRWSDSAHSAIGYECNLAFNGQYAEIIKWPGPIGKTKTDFKFVSTGNPVSGGVHDGDIFQADIIGNVITSRLNGKVIATGTDSSIASGGAPGMGFYAEGAPASKKFSFTHFSGTGL